MVAVIRYVSLSQKEPWGATAEERKRMREEKRLAKEKLAREADAQAETTAAEPDWTGASSQQ